MRKDFDRQWDSLRQAVADQHCPLRDDEVRQMADQARHTWPQGAAIQPSPDMHRSRTSSRKVAAVVLLLVAGAAVAILPGHRVLPSVSLDGSEVYFACNNSCSPESTLQMLNEYIDRP